MSTTHLTEITPETVLGSLPIQPKSPELMYVFGNFEAPVVAALPTSPIMGIFYAINLVTGQDFVSRKLNLGAEYNDAMRQHLSGRDFMYGLLATPKGSGFVPLYVEGQELMGATFFFRNETAALLDLASTLLEEEDEKNIVLN